MEILSTITPIFIVIGIGRIAKQKNFMPDAFLEPANKLVYYLAIPAMIFRAVSKASIKDELNVTVTLISIGAIVMVAALAWGHSVAVKMEKRLRGTFIQTSFHGNLGYIGLAVVYYHLGDAGLASGGILAGFMMITQNILAVVALQLNSNIDTHRSNVFKQNIGRIVGHPVIISAVCGMLFSLSGLTMPAVLDRTLGILSAMALPLALLLIGAGISLKLMTESLVPMLQVSIYKLILIPGTGLLFFRWFSVHPDQFLPAFILLASPVATLTYVMAREMQGSPDMAAAAVSGSTLLSAISLTFWLGLSGFLF